MIWFRILFAFFSYGLNYPGHMVYALELTKFGQKRLHFKTLGLASLTFSYLYNIVHNSLMQPNSILEIITSDKCRWFDMVNSYLIVWHDFTSSVDFSIRYYIVFINITTRRRKSISWKTRQQLNYCLIRREYNCLNI